MPKFQSVLQNESYLIQEWTRSRLNGVFVIKLHLKFNKLWKIHYQFIEESWTRLPDVSEIKRYHISSRSGKIWAFRRKKTRSQLNGVFVIEISATPILLKVDDIRPLKKLENACQIFPLNNDIKLPIYLNKRSYHVEEKTRIPLKDVFVTKLHCNVNKLKKKTLCRSTSQMFP